MLKMATLCARSEQCSFDIRKKLLDKGLSQSDADSVVEELKHRKFIDDRRFAIAFMRDKIRFSHWGRVKITTHLYAKRIPKEFIKEASDQVDMKEYSSILVEIARSKAATLNLSAVEDKAKLYRWLLSRGFESGAVSKIVEHLSRNK